MNARVNDPLHEPNNAQPAEVVAGSQPDVQRRLGHRLGRGEDTQILAVDGGVECVLCKAARKKSSSKPDPMLERIMAFSEAKGGGVLIRKRSKGYCLFREDNGRRVARLRPTGKGDLVEVAWWSHRDKWDQIGDFGPMVMSLHKALDYVAKDRMGIVWG